MTQPSWRILAVGPQPEGLAGSGWGPFEIDACGDLEAARERLATVRFDGLLLVLPSPEEARRLLSWPALSQALQAGAVVVATDRPDAALAGALPTRSRQPTRSGNASSRKRAARM